MNQTILFELNRSKKRLEYYAQRKSEQAGQPSVNSPLFDKWIEIYSERVKKLEHQANQMGFKTQLKPASDRRTSLQK